MSDSERKPLPPYMPYKTFGSFLDHLRAIGMPSHIDKSVMTHLSGGMQSWLKAALRYMKLINADDTPTKLLEELAAAQGDDRKVLLKTLFDQTYAFLNGKVDLKNTTPAKLRQAVVDEGGQGDTVDKIIAFMLAMAKDANVQLAQLLTKRAASVRRPRAKTAKGVTPKDDGGEEPDDNEQGDTQHGQAMKTITLESGTLTLSGNINLFTLKAAERTLVFALIDAMNDFEREQAKGAGSA